MEKKSYHLKYLIPIMLLAGTIVVFTFSKEWLAYQQCKIFDSYQRELAFFSDYPTSDYIPKVRNLISKYEKVYVDSRFNNLKRPSNIDDPQIVRKYLSAYKEYSSVFPGGEYKTQVDEFIEDYREYDEYSLLRSNTNTSVDDLKAFLLKYPDGAHHKIVEYLIETDEYKDYSLKNGSQPYAKYYGYNASSSGSSIVIKSSSNHDCVVTVKYNNSDGNVAGHVYVHRGESAEIKVPSGRTYQVFFYSGTGWYPKKEMSKGILGGFLSEESFSYDSKPFLLSYGEYVTYTLSPVIDGNFSPSTTNQNAFF